jgi:Arabinose efflux permease
MQAETSAQRVIERNVPRNFTLGVLDGAAYMFGINLVARYTVLPKFVSELTDERWVQGLIPMLTQTGWTLPALFIAPVVASWPRRKSLVMLLTLGERLPFLILGLLLFFLPTLPASILLVSFFVLYGIQSFSGGATMSAWNDLIARLIPARRWGTFFGLQFGLGSVFGVGSAWLAGRILEDVGFPYNFAYLALLCFGAQMISYLFLASYVEPPQEVKPRQAMGAFLSSIVPLLKGNKAFRRYLLCRSGIALALVGHSFFTAAALEGFKMSNEQLGLFTGVMLAAQALSHFGLGALADRWGHKQILELATFVGALGMVIAVLAPSIWWFVAVFICVGFAQAGYQISGMTLVFQFSTPHERPTYIGVANTLLAPVSMVGPLVAGFVAEFSGYNVMFLCLTVIGVLSLISLHWSVHVAAKPSTALANEAVS